MNRTKSFVWVSTLFIAGLVYSQTRVATDDPTVLDELLASVLSPDAPPPLNLPLVASNAVPAVATFWSAQASENSPPCPFNPVAELGLPVYSLGNNSYLFDDRTVSYDAWHQVQAALRQLASGMSMDSLDPGEGEGTNEFGGGWTNNFVSPVYTTNDLWLEITKYAEGAAAFIIHAPAPAAYDLFGTSNLNLAVAGRLHRLHDSKREVIVYDYADGCVPVLSAMYSKRVRGYEAIGYEIQEPQ